MQVTCGSESGQAVLSLRQPPQHDEHLSLPPSPAADPAPNQPVLAGASTPASGEAPMQTAAPPLLLPGGQTLATFFASWDQLTARLLPRDSTGATADMLLASIRLLLSCTGSAPSGGLPATSCCPAQDGSSGDATAGSRGSHSLSVPAPGQSACEPDSGQLQNVQQLLAVALQLADLSAAGLPLDASAVAAGLLAEVVHRGQLSLPAVETAVGPDLAHLLAEVATVHNLTAAVDVYDDATSRFPPPKPPSPCRPPPAEFCTCLHVVIFVNMMSAPECPATTGKPFCECMLCRGCDAVPCGKWR